MHEESNHITVLYLTEDEGTVCGWLGLCAQTVLSHNLTSV